MARTRTPGQQREEAFNWLIDKALVKDTRAGYEPLCPALNDDIRNARHILDLLEESLAHINRLYNTECACGLTPAHIQHEELETATNAEKVR